MRLEIVLEINDIQVEYISYINIIMTCNLIFMT
jgi:hypothetical protein